jgi:hypothetical protein
VTIALKAAPPAPRPSAHLAYLCANVAPRVRMYDTEACEPSAYTRCPARRHPYGTSSATAGRYQRICSRRLAVGVQVQRSHAGRGRRGRGRGRTPPRPAPASRPPADRPRLSAARFPPPLFVVAVHGHVAALQPLSQVAQVHKLRRVRAHAGAQRLLLRHDSRAQLRGAVRRLQGPGLHLPGRLRARGGARRVLRTALHRTVPNHTPGEGRGNVDCGATCPADRKEV